MIISWLRRNKLFVAFTLIVCAVLGVLVGTTHKFYIPSASMEPTMKAGDYVVSSDFIQRDITRGTIVVFTIPDAWVSSKSLVKSGELLIKRVIGVAGDHVVCDAEAGTISVNGETLTEPYVQGVSNIPCDATVPEGSIFVAGDNRENSADSRYYSSDPFVLVSSVVATPSWLLVPPFSWSSL